MEPLTLLEQRLSAEKKAEEEAAKPKPETEDQPNSSQPSKPKVTDKEAAENAASRFIRVNEVLFKVFGDSRVDYPDEIYQEGIEALAPLAEKYGVTAGGGKLPFEEETDAGIWLGRLWRNTINAIREMRAADKEKDKGNQDNGHQREHEPSEPTPAISSDERPREERSVQTSQWDQAHG